MAELRGAGDEAERLSEHPPGLDLGSRPPRAHPFNRPHPRPVPTE